MSHRRLKLPFLFFWSLVSFLLIPIFHQRSASESPPLAREKEQILFVAVDGIPFQMVNELYKNRELPQFQPPTRVISTFPSTTTTGFTGIFRAVGAAEAPGYDARFFSYNENKVLGNLLEAYDYEAANFHHFFSYNRNTGFQQVVMYTSPSYAMRKDLVRLKHFIWDHPDKEAIFFYIGSTDGTGHLDGQEKTRKLFLEIIDDVENLRAAYRQYFMQDLKVVFFSDHGFQWNPLKKIDIDDIGDRLRRIGLELSEDLKSDKNVVAITWGNISGGDFYTSPELAEKVANNLSGVSGVDLVMYRQNDRFFILSQREELESAEIIFNKEGTEFGYLPIHGDPLRYKPFLEEFKKENKINASNLISENDWFEKTKENNYPDALYRIHDAFFGLVENPATILISTREDYEFGDSLTRFGASIRGGITGTHGAITLNSSSAFIMTTDKEVKIDPVVRYDQALLPFEKVIQNSFHFVKINRQLRAEKLK